MTSQETFEIGRRSLREYSIVLNESFLIAKDITALKPQIIVIDEVNTLEPIKLKSKSKFEISKVIDLNIPMKKNTESSYTYSKSRLSPVKGRNINSSSLRGLILNTELTKGLNLTNDSPTEKSLRNNFKSARVYNYIKGPKKELSIHLPKLNFNNCQENVNSKSTKFLKNYSHFKLAPHSFRLKDILNDFVSNSNGLHKVSKNNLNLNPKISLNLAKLGTRAIRNSLFNNNSNNDIGSIESCMKVSSPRYDNFNKLTNIK